PRSTPQPAAGTSTRSTPVIRPTRRLPRRSAASPAASAAIVTSAQPPARPTQSTIRRKRRLKIKGRRHRTRAGIRDLRCPFKERPGLWPLPECALGSGVRANSLRLRTLLWPCAPALRPARAKADRLPAVRWLARLRSRLLLVRLLHVCHQ